MKVDVVSLNAYAKINLHLRVLGKRSDGFHSIESVFQRISIADSISITRCPRQSYCAVESPLLSLPTVNTVSSAWHVFQKALSIREGAVIRVLKHIPAGSGLGGGSSDAAAVLCAADTLFQTKLSRHELMQLALRIGSDVPFFLGPAASIVTGRGEVLNALPPRSDLFGILIVPSAVVSTKAAYQKLDRSRIEKKTDIDKTWSFEYIKTHYFGFVESWPFFNDFQPIIEDEFPIVETACSDLYAQGAAFVQMSGSGAAVFGLFQSEQCLHAALAVLSKKWQWCRPFLLLA